MLASVSVSTSATSWFVPIHIHPFPCSPEEVKKSVGTAVRKVVDPIKSKVRVTCWSRASHMLVTC